MKWRICCQLSRSVIGSFWCMTFRLRASQSHDANALLSLKLKVDNQSFKPAKTSRSVLKTWTKWRELLLPVWTHTAQLLLISNRSQRAASYLSPLRLTSGKMEIPWDVETTKTSHTDVYYHRKRFRVSGNLRHSLSSIGTLPSAAHIYMMPSSFWWRCVALSLRVVAQVFCDAIIDVVALMLKATVLHGSRSSLIFSFTTFRRRVQLRRQFLYI